MIQGEIMRMVGQGYIVLAGNDSARLVPRPRISDAKVIDVPPEAVTELIRKHLLGEINQEGYPAVKQRKPGEGYKMGWEEMGLPAPADGQKYYLLIQ